MSDQAENTCLNLAALAHFHNITRNDRHGCLHFLNKLIVQEKQLPHDKNKAKYCSF